MYIARGAELGGSVFLGNAWVTFAEGRPGASIIVVASIMSKAWTEPGSTPRPMSVINAGSLESRVGPKNVLDVVENEKMRDQKQHSFPLRADSVRVEVT